jgi:ABC-type branched-subunit amino acid transport system substrate-binding protein
MGTDKSTGWFTGLYAYDKLGYKTATTMLEDMVSGYDKVGAAQTAFKKEGGNVIQQQAIPSGTVDFSSYLAALKPADCLIVWVTPGPMARFVQQYYDAGKTTPLVIPDASVLFSKTMSQIGDKTLGIVAEVNYTTLLDTPMNKDWVAGFTKAMGYVPTIQGASSDQNLLLYLEALKLTGGDATPAKVNDALLRVKVDSPAGTVSFNNQRLGIGDLYMAKSVKVPDTAVGGSRIDWQVLDAYKQVQLDMPGQ